MSFKYEYTINAGYTDAKKVSADAYGFGDGFIHFTDAEKLRVFSISSEQVRTIERTDANK